MLLLFFCYRWTNTSLDMLKCVSCQAALMIKIHPKIREQKTLQKLIKAYQTKLATSHSEVCPFRFDACLYLLPKNTANKRKEEEEKLIIMDSDDSGDDDNSQAKEIVHQRIQTENVVPPLFASILRKDVWSMIENPDPVKLVQARFQQLRTSILRQAGDSHGEGAPPQWQFPPLILSEDILAFDVAHENNITTAPSITPSKKSRKNTLLARLAFDPKRPLTAMGVEKETLLTRLEEIMVPPTEEDEIRARTRNQEAWEHLEEGLAALALFGWVPKGKVADATSPANRGDATKGAVSLECPVCLAKLNFNMQQYDRHHHQHHSPRKMKPVGDDTPPSKRRRLEGETNEPETLQPLTSHRYYCPYVCGFPRDGERKGTPVWQTIVSKLFLHKKSEDKNDSDNDDDGDAATERLLQLLQSGVSRQKYGKDAKNELNF